MKYFAKYLPVEGGIKEGDYVDIGSQVIIYSTKWQKTISKYNPKKVKLFLCSRDIQVGDTVWNGRKGLLVFEDESEGRPEGNWMHLSAITIHDFKSIGEISPDATWVKEGDEFSKEEIIIVLGRTYECLCEEPGVYRTAAQGTCEHMVDDHRGGDFCNRKTDYVKCVKIKGPCGHFH